MDYFLSMPAMDCSLDLSFPEDSTLSSPMSVSENTDSPSHSDDLASSMDFPEAPTLVLSPEDLALFSSEDLASSMDASGASASFTPMDEDPILNIGGLALSPEDLALSDCSEDIDVFLDLDQCWGAESNPFDRSESPTRQDQGSSAILSHDSAVAAPQSQHEGSATPSGSPADEVAPESAQNPGSTEILSGDSAVDEAPPESEQGQGFSATLSGDSTAEVIPHSEQDEGSSTIPSVDSVEEITLESELSGGSAVDEVAPHPEQDQGPTATSSDDSADEVVPESESSSNSAVDKVIPEPEQDQYSTGTLPHSDFEEITPEAFAAASRQGRRNRRRRPQARPDGRISKRTPGKRTRKGSKDDDTQPSQPAGSSTYVVKRIRLWNIRKRKEFEYSWNHRSKSWTASGDGMKRTTMRKSLNFSNPLSLTVSVDALPLEFRYEDGQWETFDSKSHKRTLATDSILDLVADPENSLVM